jgi:hypothetical protein
MGGQARAGRRPVRGAQRVERRLAACVGPRQQDERAAQAVGRAGTTQGRSAMSRAS